MYFILENVFQCIVLPISPSRLFSRFMHTDLPDKLHCDKVVEIVNIIEYDSDAEENGDDDIGDGVGAGARYVMDQGKTPLTAGRSSFPVSVVIPIPRRDPVVTEIICVTAIPVVQRKVTAGF